MLFFVYNSFLYVFLSYSTLFPDTNNHTFFSQSRIIELIPEYEDSLQWFYKNHALELAKKGKAQSITEDHKGV